MTNPTDRPVGLPDKYWDSENNTVRIDSLIKSQQDTADALKRANDQIRSLESPNIPSRESYNVDLPAWMKGNDALLDALHKGNILPDTANAALSAIDQHVAPAIAERLNDAELRVVAAHWRITKEEAKARQEKLVEAAINKYGEEKGAIMTTGAENLLDFEKNMADLSGDNKTVSTQGSAGGGEPLSKEGLNKITHDDNYKNSPELQAKAADYAQRLAEQTKAE